MRGSGLPFSGRPWRVQDFDISVVCGMEMKLCHNLPRRGLSATRHPLGGSGDAEKSFMRAGTRDGGSELTATGRAHGPSSLFSTPTPPRRGFSLPMRAAAKKAPGAPVAPCVRSCVRDRAARGSATCCLPSSSRCRERLFGRAVRDARGRCRPRLADPLHDSGVSWPSHEWSEPWLSPSRRPSLTICRNSVPIHSCFAAADGNWRRSIDFLSVRRSCFGQFLS